MAIASPIFLFAITDVHGGGGEAGGGADGRVLGELKGNASRFIFYDHRCARVRGEEEGGTEGRVSGGANGLKVDRVFPSFFKMTEAYGGEERKDEGRGEG